MCYAIPEGTMGIINKKKHNRSKRGKGKGKFHWSLRLLLICMVFTGLSVLFVSGYRALLVSPLLQITTIRVKGCQRLDPQTVIAQAKIPFGANILSLDLTAVSRKLTDHPWISEALIIREIPDRIRIEIEERKPVALVRGHDFFLMDSQGECFTRVTPSDYTDLPIITGIEPATLGPDCNLSPDFTTQIKDLYRECRLQLPWYLISEIHWNRLHGLSLFTTQGGIQIDLGTRDYTSRIARLEKVLRYLMDKGTHSELRGIDLTHGDRVLVRGNFQVPPQDRPKQRGV